MRHRFHVSCIRVWFDEQLSQGYRRTCPLCRTTFPSAKMIARLPVENPPYSDRYMRNLARAHQLQLLELVSPAQPAVSVAQPRTSQTFSLIIPAVPRANIQRVSTVASHAATLPTRRSSPEDPAQVPTQLPKRSSPIASSRPRRITAVRVKIAKRPYRKRKVEYWQRFSTWPN
ncbi:hypothetical protein MJO28_003078 [Puccinia striiformis f. sp. tritici]|uniref:Uncharacterized protein n=4 Tax=Puccinia striiformis TaxID=27350 RepID=A0A0L0UXR5_9BASI|nr:hypothetical protein Pst134EA_005006 [Puccinia striiformis f. sp. tritici]KAI9621769.1 hypothetical protein H4Q26_015535 [Puccinia striiformis f. sp. tritici PST-130]KNE91815.1 hypothetical protein PSTG_14775 [Puccinia striiformis f. sp. tritici PST-78]POV96017.1 hypothetical protein PSHT_15355 [Puccinia striiformis]KAH9471098.1 hypothetical protein Pst134EA_005006 [Puccinia striiformis f. sp. tritici]KAI7959287.1 hypothetical protein MJO28_003078 [Puccinia striiformis f. sp. tritici]